MKHWQKLKRLPIIPPRRTTSQFLAPAPALLDNAAEVGRNEWIKVRIELQIASERDINESGEVSLERYHSISRGNRGRGMVNAMDRVLGSPIREELDHQVDRPRRSSTRAKKTVITIDFGCNIVIAVFEYKH